MEMIIKPEDIYYGVVCQNREDIKADLYVNVRVTTIFFYQLISYLNDLVARNRDPLKGEDYREEKIKFTSMVDLVLGTLYSANGEKIPKISHELIMGIVPCEQFVLGYAEYRLAQLQIQKLNHAIFKYLEEVFYEEKPSQISKTCIYKLVEIFLAGVDEEEKKLPPQKVESAQVISLAEKREEREKARKSIL